MNFTHLHVHSHYSLLDGMSKVPQLIEKSIAMGMPAIALTDHGNMYGIKELLDTCKDINKKRKEKAKEEGTEYVPFKPIVGCEAYCARRGRHSKEKDEAVNGEGRTYIIDRSGWHLILLAKNMQGYRNLCRIVSLGWMDDAFNYTSRIDKELLEEYHEGIICCSACLGGEISQKILLGLSKGERAEDLDNGAFQEAQEAVVWFKNLFGEDYYIELQRHQTDKPNGDQDVYQKQIQVNPVLIALARKYGIKLIATNDVHFVEEEHAEAHDRLICLSTGRYVDEVNRMHYTKQEWLKSTEQMAAIFSDIPEALENTQEIVDKVEIYDIDSDPIMPKFPIPEEFGTEETYHQKFTEQQLFDEFTRDEKGNVVLDEEKAHAKVKKLGGYERLYRIKLEADYLEHLTMKGALERYGEERIKNDTELLDRIQFELHTMKTMGFPGYFLIVMDFIRGAREELDVSVGPGRGSAAGSVVAYCLHITDLDPLKYDLLFERFLNPDRISLPDIDTDFEDCGRPKVLDWVSNKYGHTHVAHIITYGTMATKSALADVGRVQRVPLDRVNAIKAMIPDAFPDTLKDEKGKTPKINLKNCYKYVDELRELLDGGEPEVRSMLRYAQQLEDTIRQVGIHACGVIIGADDLTKFAPLSSVEDKDSQQRVLVTEYDGHVVESVGLIKMDFLGLKTLTIIKECLRQIKNAKGDEVDIDHIPLDDELTYRLFSEGKTIAVFQFESPGMQKYLRELQPNVITDLIAMNALYRPGPIAYIPTFIKRKRGEEAVTYDLPEMEPYLKDTYGVTVYQEQVMLLSRALANFTRGESDNLRKAMGKKKIDIVEKMEKQFIDGGKANGHPEDKLKKIYDDWRAFASYAFNKSHAACYAWVAYQTGYLKAHYPAEFMAANLTIAKDDIKEVTKFMDECRNLNIKVLSPDVNESDMNFTVNKDGHIRFGLGGIKGVGEAAVQAIINERQKNGKYKSIYDFVERINLQACNRKTIENLALAGAFDCFEEIYREQLLGVTEKGEGMLEAMVRYGNLWQTDHRQMQNSLFGDLSDGVVEIQKPALPTPPRASTIERLNIEKQLIGIYLSAHPLDDYEFEVTHLSNTNAMELQQFDTYRTAESRKAQNTSSNNSEMPAENTDDAEKKEDGSDFNPTQWIKEHDKQTVRFGGIITQAEERISKKGYPYGQYTIEDYSGSYRMVLFGEQYKQFAPVLKPDMYVYITGVIQQQFADSKWAKVKPIEDTNYELHVQNVDLLKDIQEKQVNNITLSIPLQAITPMLIEDICATCKEHPGKAQLKIQIRDTEHRYTINFSSSSISIKVDQKLLHWFRLQASQNGIQMIVNG